MYIFFLIIQKQLSLGSTYWEYAAPLSELATGPGASSVEVTRRLRWKLRSAD